MASELYEIDALAWGELQASLLGRLAAGERVSEAIDWSNVIEEIRDVGLSELHACQILLTRALERLLKIWAWPDNLATGQWRGETVGFLNEAGRRLSPSMRQRIDVADLYGDALSVLRSGLERSDPPREWPAACPFTLDELLAERSDLAAFAAKLSKATP